MRRFDKTFALTNRLRTDGTDHLLAGASNAKAKRELGWQPAWPTWREGFRHGLSESAETASRAASRR